MSSTIQNVSKDTEVLTPGDVARGCKIIRNIMNKIVTSGETDATYEIALDLADYMPKLVATIREKRLQDISAMCAERDRARTQVAETLRHIDAQAETIKRKDALIAELKLKLLEEAQISNSWRESCNAWKKTYESCDVLHKCSEAQHDDLKAQYEDLNAKHEDLKASVEETQRHRQALSGSLAKLDKAGRVAGTKRKR